MKEQIILKLHTQLRNTEKEENFHHILWNRTNDAENKEV